mmetsp:Transcript_8365/g.34952  ORF Transcript_8365/g.34952 Transcript_8365/m.34952 type:complete len:257 (-) Transcript_8365:67-837(-)
MGNGNDRAGSAGSARGPSEAASPFRTPSPPNALPNASRFSSRFSESSGYSPAIMACADCTVRLVPVDRIFTAADASASARLAGRPKSVAANHARNAEPVCTSCSKPCFVSWPCHEMSSPSASTLRASRSAGLAGDGAAFNASAACSSSESKRLRHWSFVSKGRGLMDVRSPCRVSTCTNARRAPGCAAGGGAGTKVTAPPRGSFVTLEFEGSAARASACASLRREVVPIAAAPAASAARRAARIPASGDNTKRRRA